MSTVRHASVLAVFTIFCVNILTKSDKRFIISLQMNIGIFRNTARAEFSCGYRETGCESPTQKRHCKVYVLSDGAAARSLAGAGKALRKERAFAPRTKSGYSVPISTLGFPKGAVCKCIKTFAPRFEKTLVLFYCRNRRERTLPFFTP